MPRARPTAGTGAAPDHREIFDEILDARPAAPRVARYLRSRLAPCPGRRTPIRCRSLARLSIVIPARDEAGCIASTVEHLHVELRLHDVPHEIVVVDDGSTRRDMADSASV